MRQQRVYPSVQITAKAERLVKQGHPWIYGAELKSRQEPPENGGLIDVFAGSAIWGPDFITTTLKSPSDCSPETPMTGSTKRFGGAEWSMLWPTAKR